MSRRGVKRWALGFGDTAFSAEIAPEAEEVESVFDLTPNAQRLTPDACIAAIATPPGAGGIAIVRVSGAGAREIGAQVFRPFRGGNPAMFAGYTVHYGQIVAPDSGEILDDGLLTVFRTPHSYTGEDTVELSCHGGRTMALSVLQACLEAGARLAEPGEFTQRAFLNGKMDLAQAEAVADVIRARTESALRVARRQLSGGLSAPIARLRHDLIGCLAAIEVTIDFSEEVGELDHADIATQILTSKSGVEVLLADAERGRILREGVRVAIVGKPNVGKSSLLNALLRTERAIVTPIAGTTRDTLEESASVGGVPFVLVDTAGIRATDDLVEQIGVDKARRETALADVVLFVLDATTGFTDADQIVLDALPESIPLLVALNKSDLVREQGTGDKEQDTAPPTPQDWGEKISAGDSSPQTWEEPHGSPQTWGVRGADNPKSKIQNPQSIRVSAQTGAGLPELEAALLTMALGSDAAEAAETVLVTQARHRVALEAACDSLALALATAQQHLPGDFIAIDVRGALDALGTITGETVSDEIVHRIFADFCVGK